VIALGIALAARTAQISVRDAFNDADQITTGIVDAIRALNLDGLIVEIPPDCFSSKDKEWTPSGDSTIRVLGEVIRRTRILLAESGGVIAAMPGPWRLTQMGWLSHDEGDFSGAIDDLVPVVGLLEPDSLDGLAVLEDSVADSADLDSARDALVPIWNLARHFAVPSLFVAHDGPRRLDALGADALAVSSWVGPEFPQRSGSRIGGWLTEESGVDNGSGEGLMPPFVLISPDTAITMDLGELRAKVALGAGRG
jgi:hypothetical protein